MNRNRLSFGFTLVEVLFAVFIIAGALIVFSGVMLGTTRQARAGGDSTQVVFAATEILEMETARLKAGGVAGLTCGEPGPVHRAQNGTEYALDAVVTKLRLDAASGELVSVPCAALDPDAYEVALVLSWVQDGVDLSEEYRTVIAAETVTAPVIDAFAVDGGGHTAFVGDPGGEATLHWETSIGTQPLQVSIAPNSGSALTGLRHSDNVVVAPSQSTRFMLKVANVAGEDTASVVVFVDDIEIEGFAPHAPVVGPDEPVELSWRYTAPFDPPFEVARLNGVDVGSATTWSMPAVTGDESFDLVLSTPAVVDGAPAPVHELAHASTSVRFSANPVIDHFSLAPAQQCREPGGNLVDLSWRVYAAKSVTLDEGGHPQAVAFEESVSRTINGSTTFTLRGVNAMGAVTSVPLTASVLEYPTIDFRANRLSIVDGTAVNLTWTVTDADSVKLDDAAVGLTGSVWLEPLARTTYTLWAANDGECADQETLTIDVEPIAFKEVSFSPPEITIGKTSAISWGFTNTLDPTYHRVVLIPEGQAAIDVTNVEQYTVNPTSAGTHKYRLELWDRSPNRLIASIERELTVIPEASIDAFTASRQEVCEGTSVVLTWQTSNATVVRLNPGVGGVAVNGSVSIAFTKDTELVLEAENRLGDKVTQPLFIDVTPNPVIQHFAVAPEQVAEGTPATLSWGVAGAQKVSVTPGVGTVTPVDSGTLTIWPSADTTYRLRAEIETGPAGRRMTCATESAPVATTIEPVRITSFASEYPAITRLGSQELSWAVSPYVDPLYHRLVLKGSMAGELDVTGDTSGAKPSAGARSVTTTQLSGTATFTLEVRERQAPGRLIDSATITLPVVMPPEVYAPLKAAPAEVCAPSGVIGVDYAFRYGAGSLTWTGAASPIDLGSTESVIRQGTQSFTITQTTDFTLTVTSPSGETVSGTARATMHPRPVVNTFEASKTIAVAGEPVQLTWNTSGAETITLDGQPVNAAGSATVHPTSTTTYTLRVETAVCGPQELPITIEVPAPPRITGFQAQKAKVAVGGSNTLTWTLANFDPNHHKAVIPGLADVTTASSRSVPVASAGIHTYSLEIRSRHDDRVLLDGPINATFQAGTPPTISDFRADNIYTCSTGNVTRSLRWTTSGATTATLNGASVATNTTGSNRSVRDGQTWTLVASNDYGSASRSLTFQRGTIPTVTSLTATPSSPIQGQTYNVKWTTSGASTLTINGTSRPVNSNFNDTKSGPGNYTYTAIATSAQGCESQTKNLTVTVRAAFLNVTNFNGGIDAQENDPSRSPGNWTAYISSSSPVTQYAANFGTNQNPGLTITSPYTVRRSANSTIGPAQPGSGLNNFAFSGTSPAEDRNVVVWGIAMELLINDDGQYGMVAGMTTDHVRNNAIGNHLEYPNNYFQCGLKAYEIRVNNVWYTLVWSGISDTLEANKSQPSLRGLKVERTGNTADGVHKGLRLHQVDAHIRVTKDTGQNPLCEQRIVGGNWSRYMGPARGWVSY